MSISDIVKDLPPTRSGEPQVDRNVVSANKQRAADFVKKGWATFHNYFVYVLIALAMGSYIGIKVSGKFYADKMKDCILVQGLVFDGKPYTVMPK
jgi:hypothetical protein